MESRPLDYHYDPVFTTAARARGSGPSTLGALGNTKCLFHHRAPTQTSLPPNIIQRPPSPIFEPPSEIARTVRIAAHAGPVDVGIQTMYRDIETQTDPYSPEYTIVGAVDGDEVPDIFALGLHELTYRHGQLPAGMDEIEAITKIQEKQAFLERLAPAHNQKAFKQRRQMLEEQELREWQYREELIRREHAERLQIIQSMIDQRNEEVEAEKARRIQEIRLKKEQELQNYKSKIQEQRTHQKRKCMQAKNSLLEKIAQSAGANKKHDIVQLHADFGSKLYAPIKRDGKIPELERSKFEVKDLFSIDNFNELQKTIDIDESDIRVTAFNLSTGTKGRAGARKFSDPESEEKLPGSNRVRKKIERFERPPTPPEQNLKDKFEHEAISHLQAVLRGRGEEVRVKQEMKEKEQEHLMNKQRHLMTIGIQAEPEKEHFEKEWLISGMDALTQFES